MEIGESVAVSATVPAVTLLACDWTDCRKNHVKKPVYGDKGVLDRSGNFAAAWVAAKLEPWDKYGPGNPSRATLADYQAETPGAPYAVTASALKYPEYHTQKHHLISINLFKNVPKLKHDAKLVGYDVNAPGNGACYPTYVADIVQHDLQAHRGPHSDALYNSKVAPLLKAAQDACVEYCTLDPDGEGVAQARLLDDLEFISRKIEGRIKQWKLLLRTRALTDRADSRARLAALGRKAP